MSGSGAKARVFIGSSSEGMPIARALQAELGASCDVHRWDQGVFEAGGVTLDSLREAAQDADFAVLIATPDDAVTSRGKESLAARDNVIFEYALFVGVLSRQRVYLLPTADLKLPTDILGITRLPFHEQTDGNLRAAVSAAALEVEDRVKALGAVQRSRIERAAGGSHSLAEREIALVCSSAVAQGWAVKKNSETTLRLRSPRGATFSMSKTQADHMRAELKRFVGLLRANGLRVSAALGLPISESPLAT
ncbi:TIR domain-containing protein [Plantibacter sp. CFBP 8804]|uniref:TIR domain-containing protein n=1 Tax=Plantibacter sp. CFBP 8804 TaxID=2775270 RepID=UPI00177B54E0|nr:nucleotide-binding protein [Plantibacter sp. CFBP 8804]MBD8518893.1 nucleotide-binding protein [Plantibacter sp. CFBP 8804]